jgi:hypothetical protein
LGRCSVMLGVNSKLRGNMRTFQSWIRVVVLGLLCSWSAVALAEDSKTLLVPAFQGSKPQGLRDLAVELLVADGFDVVELEVTPTLTPKTNNSSVANAAGRHHARAVVMASTELSKREWESSFTVRDGETGKTLGKFEIAAATFPGLQSAFRRDFVDLLLPLLEQSSGAAAPSVKKEPKPEPKPVTKPEPEPEPQPVKAREPIRPKPSDEPHDAEPSPEAQPDEEPSDEAAPAADEGKPNQAEALVLHVGPAFLMRSWEINDPLTNANDGPLLAAHSAPGFGVHAAMRLYPAAFVDQAVLRHIGIILDYARTFASQTNVENVTNDSDDGTRDTTIQSFLVGLHVRVPLGLVDLGVAGAYGFDSMTLAGSKAEVAIPDVSASFIRAVLNGDLNLGSSTRIGIALGYRFALGFGTDDGQLQAANWFPDAVGGAMDGRLEVRQMFTKMFGLSLGGGLTYYVLDFAVGPDHIEAAEDANLSAPPVAGGASDMYTSVDLNAVVVF